MFEYNDDWNFYLDEDGIAYTEDGVMVHNIYIYNVPRDVTAEYMRCYFSDFGKVTNVKLLPHRQAGYVHFADPLAAAQALEKDEHTLSLMGKRCNVEACHSWHQPSAIGETSAESSDNGATQSSTVTLEQLNDKCLLDIFGYLKLDEQIHFAVAHSRFTDLFETYFNKDFTVVDMDKLGALKLWQQRELFRLLGSKMQTVMFNHTKWSKDYRRDRSIDLMCRWSTNVKSIIMYLSHMPHANFQRIPNSQLFKLLQNMQHQITDLQLVNLSLKNDVVLKISKLTNLRTLSLSRNDDLTGEYLDGLRTVQQLNLSDCRGVEEPFVRGALKALPQLASLNLISCFRNLRGVVKQISGGYSKLEVLKITVWTDDTFNYVVQLTSLQDLTLVSGKLLLPMKEEQDDCIEYLGLCGQAEAKLLTQLKYLRRLHFDGIFRLNDICMREFAKLKLLQELEVLGNDLITDEGVEDLLRGCKKLKRLNLALCTGITEALLHKALDVVMETRWERNALVEINVCGTFIRKSIVEEDAKYKNALAKNLLKMCCNI